MLLDALLNFVPAGSALAVQGTAVPSTNIIDILGTGVGTTPTAIFGTPTLFGAETGVGFRKPLIEIILGNAAWVSGTSLTVAFQGAVDVATTHAAGAWVTYSQSPTILTASLTANQVIRMEWPTVFPFNTAMPRYLRLLFTPAGTFTVGTIAAAVVTMGRDDMSQAQAARNFVVA